MRRVLPSLHRRSMAGVERTGSVLRAPSRGLDLHWIRGLLFAFLTLAGSSTVAEAQTNWYVDLTAPSYGNGSPALPFPSIQRALDHPGRVQGDVIRIRPGVYDEELLITGPGAILEPTAQGQGTVVLDGGRTHRVLDILGPARVRLERLTFRGGFAGQGAGVRATDCLLEMVDCDFIENQIDGTALFPEGAALWASGCDLIVSGSSFCEHDEGGALALTDCRMLLDDCIVRNNARFSTVFGPASGLTMTDCWVLMRDSLFTLNGMSSGEFTPALGGALQAVGGGLMVEGCTFLSNWNEFRGGSMVLADTHATIVNTTFTDERSFDQYGGGAIYMHDGQPVSVDLIGCHFEGCRAGEGGALYLTGGSLTANDCRFHANEASSVFFLPESGRGGAVYAYPGSSAVFTRCIFTENVSHGDFDASGAQGGAAWGNILFDRCTLVDNDATDESFDPGEGDAGYDVEMYQTIAWGGQPDALAGLLSLATYCDIEGGFANTGNVDVDPHFWNESIADYHLMPSSAGRDGGDPLEPLDGDGSLRDMGAFPFVVGDYAPDPQLACSSEPDSVGGVATIGFTGDPGLTPVTPFEVIGEGLRPNTFGYLFLGTNHLQQPFNGGGTVCFDNMLMRTALAFTGGDDLVPGSGSLSEVLDPALLLGLGLGVGDPVVAQYWYYDMGTGFAQTDALIFTLQP